jgi:predicted transcriptional regulator with HTH domain
VVIDGEIIRNLDGKGLRNTLFKYLITDLYPQSGAA